MNIAVCIKQVLDPEIPIRHFKIDSVAKKAVEGNASLVISTFDEIALEVALQARERSGGGTVTAISFGPRAAEEVLRRALAMLADDAILINNKGLEYADSFITAKILTAAIKKLDNIDLILCGRQAGDTDGEQVGLLIAEELGIPALTYVTRVKPQNQTVCFVRDGEGCTEIVEGKLPLLATVTNSEHNVPRAPKVKDIMASYRKPLSVWGCQDIGLSEEDVSPASLRANIIKLYVPIQRGGCLIVEGESPEEKVDNMLRRLHELKLV